eukprot:gene1665-435_t
MELLQIGFSISKKKIPASKEMKIAMNAIRKNGYFRTEYFESRNFQNFKSCCELYYHLFLSGTLEEKILECPQHLYEQRLKLIPNLLFSFGFEIPGVKFCKPKLLTILHHHIDYRIEKCASNIHLLEEKKIIYKIPTGKTIVKMIFKEHLKPEIFKSIYSNDGIYPTKEETHKYLMMLPNEVKRIIFQAIIKYDSVIDLNELVSNKEIQNIEEESISIFKPRKKIGISFGIDNDKPLKKLNSCFFDAKGIKESLEFLNFKSTCYCDSESEEIRDIIEKTIESLEDDTLLFFFYSGHGNEINGINYIYGKDGISTVKSTYNII